MTKDYYNAHINLLKFLYKYNKVEKDCANYFLNKYYKKKAEGIIITMEDL